MQYTQKVAALIATSALATEPQQLMISKTFTFYLYTVEYYRLLQSRTPITMCMPSEHLFGVDRKHLPIQRGAIISGLKRILTVIQMNFTIQKNRHLVVIVMTSYS